MSFLNILRMGQGRAANAATPPGNSTPGMAPPRPHVHAPSVSPAGPSFAPRTIRASNSLKDFLWHLSGLGRGTLLDLGPVWQSTVSFFLERGFKVSTEDVLTGWKQYSADYAEQQKYVPVDEKRITRGEVADRFLDANLNFPSGSFDAILAWDLLDYLDEDIMRRTAERLGRLVRDGGLIMSVFHSQRPSQFNRYRILDERSIELVPAPPVFPHARIFQNREILDVYSRFHTSKTYLGRDQIREALFVK